MNTDRDNLRMVGGTAKEHIMFLVAMYILASGSKDLKPATVSTFGLMVIDTRATLTTV